MKFHPLDGDSHHFDEINYFFSSKDSHEELPFEDSLAGERPLLLLYNDKLINDTLNHHIPILIRLL